MCKESCNGEMKKKIIKEKSVVYIQTYIKLLAKKPQKKTKKKQTY